MSRKESFFESTVNRVYCCDNDKCEGEFFIAEKVKDPWQTKCPFCNEESLILKTGKLASSVFIDLKQPKTIGSLGEKNLENAIKRTGKNPLDDEKRKGGKVPFWRKNKKVNFNILKNPKQYVQKGIV